MYHLRRIASNLDLPECVITDAKRLYINAQAEKLIWGYSYAGIAAACLNYMSKKYHYTRPYTYFATQIKDKGENQESYFTKCYKRIVNGLSLPHLATSPVEYIPQFIHSDKLNIDAKTEQVIIKILNIALSHGYFICKNPKGVCAGAIYYACMKYNINVTQKQIATITGITDATLRTRFKEFQELSCYFTDLFE